MVNLSETFLHTRDRDAKKNKTLTTLISGAFSWLCSKNIHISVVEVTAWA